MASINSHADIVTDLRELVEAADSSPEVKDQVVAERQAVVDALARIDSLKARQIELKALRQDVTKQLQEAVADGKEAAMLLRATLKPKFGLRSERLVQFKVAPIRRRSRKKLLERKPKGREVAGSQPTTPPTNPAE